MGNAAYNYGGAAALKANTDAGGKLDHFNPEQQAQIMADYFHAAEGREARRRTYDPYIAEVQAA